jgi:hypothetical protein
MPIRRVSGVTGVTSINGFGSGTKVKRVTVGRPISNVVQNLGANIKTFDGLGDIPSIEELKLGEIGINTQDGKLYIKREYDGGVQTIVEIGAVGDESLSATTTFNAYIYTSDGTLEVITGSDDAGNVLQYDPDPNSPSRIQVYLNGVLLHQGIDYVANDGETISLTHVVDDEQVVQVAAYNSTGVSFGNDLIIDDHFAFIVGTNEETRFYHNGTDTIIKHLGFNDSQFKIQHQNDDKLIMDGAGVQLLGDYTLNGQSVATQTEVDELHTRINNLDSDLQDVTELLQELLQFRQ